MPSQVFVLTLLGSGILMSVGIVCTGKYFITTDGVGEMLYKRPGTHGLGAHSCLLSVNILEKSEAAYQQNVII